MRFKFVAMLATIAFVLAACVPVPTATQPASPEGAPTAAPVPAPASRGASPNLAGTSWLLTGLGSTTLLAGTTVTLDFGTDGRVSGSDGCNTYGTSYTTDGASLTFAQPMVSTMMACPEPIMQQATAYQQALAETTSYEISGGQLVLKDASGKAIATFDAQSQDLGGTSWQLTSYNNGKQAVVSVIIGTEITANFGKDGSLSGSAGCNNYTASYQAQDGKISIGPAASTRMACATPDGVMEQESLYLAALQTAATYRIDGSRLEMRTADDALAVSYVRMRAEKAAAPSEIQDIVWQWERFDGSDGSQTVVKDPTAYTLVLRPDGTYAVKADCNNGAGAYTLDGNSLTLQPGPMTMAQCGPDSLYDKYVTYLAGVVTYVMDDGKLVLNLKMDAGNMIFANGGPAPVK